MPEEGRRDSRKVLIGSAIASLLGLAFGAGLIVAASWLTWRSDRVLGIYNQSGWSYENLTGGDGRITFVLGIVMAAAFILGFALQSRAAYATALAINAPVLFLAVYECIHIAARQGIVSPGNGLYMLIGGTAAGALCALCGYLMMTDTRRAAIRAEAEPVQP